MKNVIYIADIDQDIDDLITIKYMADRSVFLKGVVLDPMPTTDVGKSRVKLIESWGVKVFDRIPDDDGEPTDIIYCGGALTKVAEYVKDHKIQQLVMNGGFVGEPIVPSTEALPKFRGKSAVRTFNFNCDVAAADAVLQSDNIDQIILVGKNVCHDDRNTFENIWKDKQSLAELFHVRPGKKMHDLLAVYEGLVFYGLSGYKGNHMLKYAEVYPFNNGLKGNMTEWGSSLEPTGYKKVLAAVGWV
jgi:hypothetical protein